MGFGIFNGQLIPFGVVNEVLDEGKFGIFWKLGRFFGSFELDFFSQIIKEIFLTDNW